MEASPVTMSTGGLKDLPNELWRRQPRAAAYIYRYLFPLCSRSLSTPLTAFAKTRTLVTFLHTSAKVADGPPCKNRLARDIAKRGCCGKARCHPVDFLLVKSARQKNKKSSSGECTSKSCKNIFSYRELKTTISETAECCRNNLRGIFP